MHDLRRLRDDPAFFDAAMARRGLEPIAAALLALDEEKRSIETALGEMQAERNRLSKEIGAAARRGEKPEAALTERVGALKDEIKAAEERMRARIAELDERLAGLPNILVDDVPDGRDEDDNRQEREVGEPPRFDFRPKTHDELGAKLGMDFERAAKISGARFVVLEGPLARLHRAIGQFMLDVQTREHGYLEIAPPYMVRDAALFGTGQLPKFAEQQFVTTHGLSLLPTSEVALANLVAGEIVEESDLPLRFTALTPCFRSEAGAAGRDTKGMIRQHQFDKVEMVSITAEDRSWQELERMTGCAEAILQRLGLPYRVMTLCSGDTGFGAKKTYDLEVWLPGQGRHREISSCSNCGDFQARRMNARYRGEDRKSRFVHTLNGSGVAVGRALIAVMETYQTNDGGVRVPDPLIPYMGGIEMLEPRT